MRRRTNRFRSHIQPISGQQARHDLADPMQARGRCTRLLFDPSGLYRGDHLLLHFPGFFLLRIILRMYCTDVNYMSGPHAAHPLLKLGRI